jgi:hypothetical protein
MPNIPVIRRQTAVAIRWVGLLVADSTEINEAALGISVE